MMLNNHNNMNGKVNPFIEIPEVELEDGEIMLPLNQYTNKGYIINPVYFVTNRGRYFSIATGKVQEKKLQTNSTGYLELQAATSAGQKHILAHRGVLTTFCPRPDMYDLQADHLYGNHFDNNLEHLKWVTGTENIKRSIESGISTTRSRVVSDEIIKYIITLAIDNCSDEEISSLIFKNYKTTVQPQTIRIVRTGKGIYSEILDKLNLKPVYIGENRDFRTKIKYEEYEDILLMLENKIKPEEISTKMRIPMGMVNNLISRWYEIKTETNDRERIILHLSGRDKKKKDNPIINYSQRIIDEGIQIYPVNRNCSKLHIIDPIYAVSKDGRVFTSSMGNEWREMRLYNDSKGYSTIGLQTNHGNKQYMVHRLILSTFEPRDDMYDLEIDHINRVKDDNRIENLDWVTHSENMNRNGASSGHDQKAPDKDIIRINELAWSGHSDEEISEIFENKYTPNNVKIIRTGIKTYGPVLERLGLKPFRYQTQSFNEDIKQGMYELVESRKDSIGLMMAYKEAGEKFNASPDSVRRIYSERRKKLSNQ